MRESKFTHEDIKKLQESPLSHAELGRMYGVSREYIRQLRGNTGVRHGGKEGRTWTLKKDDEEGDDKLIKVLDKGYVRLIPEGCSGTDLTVVNAARVSYDKQSTEFTDKDKRLISFLAREGHTSPFRHAMLQFEVYAPLMVARQWWKYIIGSDHIMDAWNESSRRYVSEEPTFYIPDVWRSAPENAKQGSGEPISQSAGGDWTDKLIDHVNRGLYLYANAMKNGICAEQARLFLPAYGMYVRWYWTASLLSVAHFLNQRLNHDAQVEIQEYAKAIHQYAESRFPYSIKELVK